MKHIASFLTVLLSVLAAAAQTAPKGPPPAPAVFVPPKAEEIKTFRSLTDSFSIDFAGRVTESSEKAGQFMIRNYSARRTGTRATVVAYDFGLSEPDKLDREAFLGDLKADLQRIEGTELVSDVAITIDDFNGREIVSKAGYEREITRVLFTDSSIFRLSVFVTNWHILSDEKKTEFEQEKNRFFASFKTGRRFYEGSGFRGEAIRPAAKTISASKVIETDNPRETAGSTFKVGEKNSSPPPPPPPAVLGVDQNRDVKITSSMRAAGSVPGFGTYTQYRAPQKSELKQFVSGAFDFEVVWSGTPGSRKRFIVNGTESVFFTDRFGGGYGVSVSEFSFKLSDVHSENEVFEYIRNRIRQYGVHSIKSEKRIESGGVKGIEFELESPLQFSRMRAFYTGNRIIEVSTSVPLIFFKTVAQSRNIDQFDAECRRFFNSFRLKKTEKSPDNAVVVVDLNPRKGARLPALELPDDEYDRARGRFVSRKG
ncbi:MAG: hypothetical protein OEM82_16180, partial [Acidobacteriota bacterium]|nr:hypothetical protein [Acidobacteriota bacterium]